MAIEVVKPGLATTVQDAGRLGYYHVGIPPSGALDQYAFRAANLLVGNDENEAVLECAFLGPELQFGQDAVIAVTGAASEPKVDGQAAPLNEAIAVGKGSRLSFGFMKLGARAYIAFAGGIDVPLVLGSRSTYALGAFGGFCGRKLATGDVLKVGAPSTKAYVGRVLPRDLQPVLAKEVTVRLVPGLYHHRLTVESSHSFLQDTWSVAPEADRIGYRFRHGRPLAFKDRSQPFGAGSNPSNIVDAGYPIGSVQVPGGLEPIMLHRDAVSGGGYAIIGTVISADLDIIAQLQPNNKVRFVSADMADALVARAAYRERLDKLRAALAAD